MTKDFFPVFSDIRGKKAVMIGGGAIAARRMATLCRFSFSLVAVAPDFCDDFLDLARRFPITLVRRAFEPRDLEDAFLVVAATDQRPVNREVGRLARENHQFVSVCDRREECNFYFPALIETETLTAGLIGDGSDHAAVSRAAKQIREILK